MENNEIIDQALDVISKLKKVSGENDVVFRNVQFTINGVKCEATIKNPTHKEFYLKVNDRDIKLSAYNDLCRNNGFCLSGCGRCL